jgi:hypothetical protein
MKLLLPAILEKNLFPRYIASSRKRCLSNYCCYASLAANSFASRDFRQASFNLTMKRNTFLNIEEYCFCFRGGNDAICVVRSSCAVSEPQQVQQQLFLIIKYTDITLYLKALPFTSHLIQLLRILSINLSVLSFPRILISGF